MRPPIEYLFPPELGTELIYSFVIILCSLMIYFSTKEMYKLTSYKGIKYFRLSFLFFAISFFLQYFSMFLMKFLDSLPFINISPRSGLITVLILFIYSSTLAICYLLHSVTWKRFNGKIIPVAFNLISITIAILSVIFLGRFSVFIINLVFFLFASLALIIATLSKQKTTGKSLFIVYFLLFVFFFLNIVNIVIPEFLQMYKVGLYLISIFIFMTILYKVLRKIGN